MSSRLSSYAGYIVKMISHRLASKLKQLAEQYDSREEVRKETSFEVV